MGVVLVIIIIVSGRKRTTSGENKIQMAAHVNRKGKKRREMCPYKNKIKIIK